MRKGGGEEIDFYLEPGNMYDCDDGSCKPAEVNDVHDTVHDNMYDCHDVLGNQDVDADDDDANAFVVSSAESFNNVDINVNDDGVINSMLLHLEVLTIENIDESSIAPTQEPLRNKLHEIERNTPPPCIFLMRDANIFGR